VYSIWPILMTGVALMAAGSITHAAQDTGAAPESSLEPEFRQLRERLGAAPEFQGSDAATKFRLAEELAQRGDIQGAVHAYREAIHSKPDWADPYRGLGQVLLDHHDYAEAKGKVNAGEERERSHHVAIAISIAIPMHSLTFAVELASPRIRSTHRRISGLTELADDCEQ